MVICDFQNIKQVKLTFNMTLILIGAVIPPYRHGFVAKVSLWKRYHMNLRFIQRLGCSE